MTIYFDRWQAGEKGSLDNYLLVLLVSNKQLVGTAAKEVDGLIGGIASHIINQDDFVSKSGKVYRFWAGIAKKARPYQVLLVNIDKNGTSKDFLDYGGHVANSLKNGEKAALVPVDLTVNQIADFSRGFLLRSYRFADYRKKLEEPKKDRPSLTLLEKSDSGGQDRVARLNRSVEGVFFARDLVSEPPNILSPDHFAERLKQLEKDGLKCEIFDDSYLRKEGMNAFLAVGAGSEHECRLVVMHWRGGNKKDKPLALIGKGVTFDTGGISLKPAAGMGDMKWDMGGAGTVAGVMKTLAQRKAKVNVTGIVGLVENMPDGKAQRPGDVVTSLSGQTIEVLNTDAEGRLVLADLLSWTQKYIKPDYIIDLATLTGAIIASLGHHYAGLFSNDDGLAAKLIKAGQDSGEKLWRFPMGEEYDADLKSDIADMKNIGGRMAGSITAAQFLQRFVEKDVKWAHLDIAGVTWLNKPLAIAPKGACGFGVRLLDGLIRDEFEQE